MIGEIVRNGAVVATLSESTAWYANREDVLRDLVENHSVNPPRPGDVHLPKGVAALYRAATAMGGTVRLRKPVDPLPDGVIS